MATDDNCSNGSTPPEIPADGRSDSSPQPEIPAEGRIEAPRSSSARQAQTKPKKVYPPGPPGKRLIFRWSRIDPRTGQVIYAHGRPFPIWVDA